MSRHYNNLRYKKEKRFAESLKSFNDWLNKKAKPHDTTIEELDACEQFIYPYEDDEAI